MTVINVLNKKNMVGSPKENDIMIDRSSVLGNIYPLSHGRDKCISEYEDALIHCITKREDVYGPLGVLVFADVITELRRILELCKKYKFINLYCWCAPLKCHGNVIKTLLTYSLAEQKQFTISDAAYIL